MYQSVLHQINSGPLREAYSLLPARMTSLRATAQLLKTTLQESRGVHRRQLGNGPARGLWQFELGTEKSRGGVYGVFLHPATRNHLRALCKARGVKFIPLDIYRAIEHDDVLAAGLARLNYWWVSAPMPDIYNEPASWEYYLSTWRPGKPHRDTWPRFHREVLDYLFENK